MTQPDYDDHHDHHDHRDDHNDRDNRSQNLKLNPRLCNVRCVMSCGAIHGREFPPPFIAGNSRAAGVVGFCGFVVVAPLDGCRKEKTQILAASQAEMFCANKTNAGHIPRYHSTLVPVPAALRDIWVMLQTPCDHWPTHTAAHRGNPSPAFPGTSGPHHRGRYVCLK